MGMLLLREMAQGIARPERFAKLSANLRCGEPPTGKLLKEPGRQACAHNEG
jgi:hypothetical protein